MSEPAAPTPDDRLTAALTGACRAALAYDAAIQRTARDHGKQWTGGDDLDALYVKWIRLAREAVGDTGETLPPGDDEISPRVRAKIADRAGHR